MILKEGDRIGDYEVVGLLGRGGMGKVFRVRNLISHRLEAMKVVLPDLEADPGFADRFLREIRVHASLDHPNIARLYTAFRAEHRICMILELVEGISLYEKLRQGITGLPDATGCVDQVLSALSYAHSRGVIHRDLKPANIILGAGGLVKLTDFGIALAAGVPKLTLTGVALGSLYYLSPEQVRSGTVDARSDLYSLGVTFYETVTGKRPIEGDTEYSIMNAHVQQAPVPPVEWRPDLPPAMSAVILKALAKNPAERFQSANEFQAALRAAAGMAATTWSLPVAPSRVSDTDSISTIDPAQLARAEAKLLPLLGPIAKHLVDRARKQCANLRELYASLAGHIPGPADRETFLRSLEAELEPPRREPAAHATPARPKTGSATTLAAQPWDAAVLKAARQRLAAYIGPIAGMVVERAAKRTRTPKELYEALAAEIPAERDRAAFLAAGRDG
jgi:serine/threonine-protein kinase